MHTPNNGVYDALSDFCAINAFIGKPKKRFLSLCENFLHTNRSGHIATNTIYQQLQCDRLKAYL